MTATTKKTTFLATSTRTGKTYTRTSLRAYTHAVVSYEGPESLAARQDRSAVVQDRYEAEYTLTAAYLRAGTAPMDGILTEKVDGGMSYNEQKAGVRTKWDSVRYGVANGTMGQPKNDAAATAEIYERFAVSARESAARHRARAAEIRATGEYAEGASFHHSAALAAKEADKAPAYGGTVVSEIVAAVPKA
jgi:hypothetical protein